MGRPIPANGSLLIDARGTRLGAAMLTDAGGAIIGGSAKELRGYTVWKPERVLEPGRYTFTIAPANGDYDSNTYSIEVVEAWTAGRPSVTSKLTLSRHFFPMPACCRRDGNTQSCVGSDVHVSVELLVELASSASDSALTQVLFGTGVATPEQPAEIFNVYPLDEAGRAWSSNRALTEYCVTLEAVEIASGDVYSYPDLVTRCVPHGELGSVGIERANPPERQLMRDVCATPPSGHEERWCLVNSDCAFDGARDLCEDYASLCPSFDAGVRDAGRTVDASDAADSGTKGTSEPPPSSRDRDGDGCSVRRVDVGPTVAGWYALALLSVALGLRVRRRRRR